MTLHVMGNKPFACISSRLESGFLGSSGGLTVAVTLEAVVGVRRDEEDKVESVEVDVKGEAVVGVVDEGRRGSGGFSGRKRRS